MASRVTDVSSRCTCNNDGFPAKKLSRSSNERSYLPGQYDSNFERSASFSPPTTPSSGHKDRRSDVSYYDSRHHQTSSTSRRRSRTRSRTRTRTRSRSYSRSHYRPASPSPPARRHSGRTSRERQRMKEARDHPQATRCIGVFGLNTNTSQNKVRDLFKKFGPIERIQMVIDAHTLRSRGFCFIYFEHLKDARAAKDACSGIQVDDRRIRVDYSITQRAHTPTPGIYMGRPSRPKRTERRRDRSPDDNYRHRNSHHSRTRNVRSRTRTRSRSRSRSPRNRRNTSRY